MVVTWSTWDSTIPLGGSFVKYGINLDAMNQIAIATERKFVDGGYKRSTQYIHSATMKNLKPETIYCKMGVANLLMP